MQKVVGSSPIIRSREPWRQGFLFDSDARDAARIGGPRDNPRMEEDELRNRLAESTEQVERAEKRLEEVEERIEEARERTGEDEPSEQGPNDRPV